MILQKKLLSLSILLFLSIVSVAQTTFLKIDSLIHLVTVESYSSHFDSLRTNEFCNRKVIMEEKQSKDHNACRDYIYRSFQNYLGTNNTYIHDFKINGNEGLSNVVGVKYGTNKHAGIWVISAYYDTNNNNEKNLTKPEASPGANDNGTGLAAVLEIARIIGTLKTDATIIFAAWDFEEVFTNGYPTGSNEWFTEHVKKNKVTNWEKLNNGGSINLEDIRGNINFDMFGNPRLISNEKPILWACYAKNNQVDFVDSYAATINRYIPEIKAQSYGRLIYSDHYTFASRKISSVENLESNYLDDPFYHTYSDNKENKNNINFEFATNVTQGGFAFLLEQVLPNNSIAIPIQITNDLAISETPNCYKMGLNKPNYIIQIYNQSGVNQPLTSNNGVYNFSPSANDWYYIQVIEDSIISKKKVFFEKKEGLF